MENWQTNRGLAETNLNMLSRGILSDVTFLLGDSGQAVKAHKYMLVSRSPVFYAMFCGPMAVSCDIIEIPDVEGDIFQQLLRFLYSENCGITVDMAMPLIHAAEKFEVRDLIEKCKKYLESEMSPDSACGILEQAYKFNEYDLVNRSLAYIFKNGKRVLKSAGIVSLRKDVLFLIIQSDRLQVREEEVYNACVRWAEEKCRQENGDVNDKNVRDALGLHLIKQIRFPCMSFAAFSKAVGEGNILSAEEKVNVFLQFTGNHNGQTSFFNKHPRISKKKRRIDIIRFNCFIRGIWDFGEHSDAIEFESSKDVYLTGVSLFTLIKKGDAVTGKLEVLDKCDNSIVSMDVTFNYTSGSFEDYTFRSPVRIDKNSRYTLRQTAAGLCYGEQGVKSVKTSDVHIQFFNSQKYGNGTDINRGQFNGLIFEI